MMITPNDLKNNGDLIDPPGKTNCPMCQTSMDYSLVVCWLCWRSTERLYPGVYKVPMVLSSEIIASWSKARDARVTK